MEKEVDYNNLEFGEKLGEGGFGKVHRVTFKIPFRGYTEAAAKVVSEFVKEEVDIMAKLSHPNIVILIGFLLHGPMQVILTEYAQYGSLHDYLTNQKKPLPDELKRKWIRESTLGIHYLHSNNYLHRDIKASNCLLFEANVLKLCDFGLARETSHSVTMSNQKGTLLFMAPELLHAQAGEKQVPYSIHADIYAYGMLVLEICTRRQPFQGMDFADVLYGVKKGELKPTIPLDCPKDLTDLMKQCWNRVPKQRPTLDKALQILSETQALPKKIKRETPPSGRDQDSGLASTMKESLKLSSMKTSDSLSIRQSSKWTLKKEIHPDYHGKAVGAWKVALCPNGNIITDDNPLFKDGSGLYMLGGTGKCKVKLTSPREDQGYRVKSMVVSSKGHILVLCNKGYVEVFDPKGAYMYDFPSNDEEHKWDFIAIDKHQHVLLGDQQMMALYTYPDGKVIKQVKSKVSADTESGVVNSKNQILRHYRPDGSVYSKVEVTDYSGKEVFSITPMIDEDVKDDVIHPCGISCDPHDNIYVAMRVGLQSFTGHLHVYSPKGAFQQCISKSLYYPWDVSVSIDGSSLAVANNISVLVYST